MRYALVTGGSRGIGKAICIALAKDGFPVIINYNSNDEAALEVKATIEAQGGKAELMKFNVTDAATIETSLNAWSEAHPEDYIAVLVNNAGIRMDNVLVFMEDEQWNSVINTTLGGFYNVTRRLVKTMMTKRWGRIINMASLSGLKGLPGQTNYSSAKAAVIGATKALAQEVASRKITVNAIAPGFIATDMTKDLDEKSLKSNIPAGRFGQPEEVAAVASFLASEGASYVTGNVISVNGGLYT
ncbi:MAG: 3-oxoacyl-ACP reductase FabG [Bacteroidia bacterium]|nr:3-oxoacyl-ACP reductase FabG [Bacteroidia bacterium]